MSSGVSEPSSLMFHHSTIHNDKLPTKNPKKKSGTPVFAFHSLLKNILLAVVCKLRIHSWALHVIIYYFYS